MAGTESLSSRTTLADIATHAQVSVATVSRVLNGKPGVSTEVRQRVLAALDVLGYERPDRLRVRRQGLIGLIIPELTNPVFPAFAQAIESLLAQRGYTPLLCAQSPGGTTEDEYIEVLQEHGVDGMIIVSGLHADTTASRDRYHTLRAKGIPLALVNGYDPSIDATFISYDDAASMDMVVRHLISLGHEKIGLASGPSRFIPAARKIEGFRAALAQHLGITNADDHIVETLYTVEGGQAGATQLVARGCTAITCGSDLMALGAIRAATSLGKSVPEDLSVVGYDDSTLIAFTDPPLTTVRQAIPNMAHAAVSALLAEINGAPPSRGELLFHPELIVRASTGIAPDLRTRRMSAAAPLAPANSVQS